MAKKVASPTYTFDLGTINLSEIRAPLFNLKVSTTGTLIVQNSRPANITLDLSSLNQLAVTSENNAKTAMGELINDVKFDVDFKNRTIKLSGGIAAKSNGDFAPTAKLELGVNSRGEQVLKGTIISDTVRGWTRDHSFVGSNVRFEFEVSCNEAAILPDNPGAQVSTSAESEPSWITDLAATGKAYGLTVGAVVIVAVAVGTTVDFPGIGAADDVVAYGAAAAMLAGARQIFVNHTGRLMVGAAVRIMQGVAATGKGINKGTTAMRVATVGLFYTAQEAIAGLFADDD